eukprot:6166086-Prymnesium_polylepis.1
MAKLNATYGCLADWTSDMPSTSALLVATHMYKSSTAPTANWRQTQQPEQTRLITERLRTLASRVTGAAGVGAASGGAARLRKPPHMWSNQLRALASSPRGQDRRRRASRRVILTPRIRRRLL